MTTNGVADEYAGFGIANRVTIVAVLEYHGIPEAVGFGVSVLQRPGHAGIGCFVYAGEVAFTAGHDHRGVGIEGVDAAEIEVGGVGWRCAAGPSGAVVGATEDGALRSGGPDAAVAGVIDAAEVGGGGGVEDLPLGGQWRDAQKADER